MILKPWGGYVFYTYIYINWMMILRWWDVMRTWWLCSTTGFYGRPVIEVTYRETLIHSTEVVWEILAWEKWLGYRHDASSMFDILGSRPVWAQYIYIYSGFQGYENLYVLYFQIYTYYKRTPVDSDLVLANWGSENIFDCPWVLKREIKP